MSVIESVQVLAVQGTQHGFLGIGIGYWLILGGAMLAGALVQGRLKSRFAEYSRDPIPFTGREIAERMLRENGITDVQITHVPGQLTDHYNPLTKTVNLSEGVYQANSVAAAAIAAHECGHAVQHANAYRWLKLRSTLVPITNAASQLMSVVFMLMFFGLLAFQSPMLLWVYIGCLAVVALFSVITLPVEFDASKRAMAWLRTSGVGGTMQQDRAENALFWAAMTYVVAALSSLATLFYFLMMALGGRRN